MMSQIQQQGSRFWVSLHGREDLSFHLRPGRQVHPPGLGPEQEPTGPRVRGGAGKHHGLPEFALGEWLAKSQTKSKVFVPPLTSQFDPSPGLANFTPLVFLKFLCYLQFFPS